MESNPGAEAEAAVDASVAAFEAVLSGSGTAVSRAPGSGPAGGLVGGADDDPLQRVADGALDVLGGLARSEAKLAAVKAHAVQVFAAATSVLNAPASSPHEATAQNRSLVAEMGCALVIGDRAAGALLAESYALTTSLPRTLAALQSGTISWAHARTMVDRTVGLDQAGAAALEAHFLDADTPKPAGAAAIGEMPAYRFKAEARTWRERHHPESLENRHAKGVADRRVECWPDSDGMAWVAACLPADQALAVWNRLNALARGMQGPDEKRTLTQIRADEFAGALLTSGTSQSFRAGNGNGEGAGTDNASSSSIRAEVLVTVPVFALLGLTDEPVMLDGHPGLHGTGHCGERGGVVPPGPGRSEGRGTAGNRPHQLPGHQGDAELAQAKGRQMPFPGCSNHALDNEADHFLAWHNGGTTGISNLGQPCPKHHRLRHTSGCTSPTGRHYTTEHQDWEPPHWAPGLTPAKPPGAPARRKEHPRRCAPGLDVRLR